VIKPPSWIRKPSSRNMKQFPKAHFPSSSEAFLTLLVGGYSVFL
jgi:hypothetical protein